MAGRTWTTVGSQPLHRACNDIQLGASMVLFVRPGPSCIQGRVGSRRTSWDLAGSLQVSRLLLYALFSFGQGDDQEAPPTQRCTYPGGTRHLLID
jgi:hypothetical protein